MLVPAPWCTARASATTRVAPAEAVRAVGPVGLLRVEEEALVEAADLLECFGTQEQHRSDHELRPARALPETECFAPRAEGVRERPGDLCGLTGFVDLHRTHGRQVGLSPQAAVQNPDLVGRDHGIRIEQQDVGAGHEAIRERDVDSRPEPGIPAGVDVSHAELGAECGDLRQRGVVHDGHRQADDGRDGLAEQVGRAVGDDRRSPRRDRPRHAPCARTLRYRAR